MKYMVKLLIVGLFVFSFNCIDAKITDIEKLREEVSLSTQKQHEQFFFENSIRLCMDCAEELSDKRITSIQGCIEDAECYECLMRQIESNRILTREESINIANQCLNSCFIDLLE
jgi:hypothetical protein